jgi:hypothetical protein
MKNRCYSTKHPHYNHYGERGITVCDEWLKSRKVFTDWANSHGYDDELTIDRIDVNGDYSPQNCRWANCKQQQRNKRNSVYVEFDGQRIQLQDYLERFGLTYNQYYFRKKKGVQHG